MSRTTVMSRVTKTSSSRSNTPLATSARQPCGTGSKPPCARSWKPDTTLSNGMTGIWKDCSNTQTPRLSPAWNTPICEPGTLSQRQPRCPRHEQPRSQTPHQQRRLVAIALTPRQQRFVEEYLIDLNATQAAIRAGYSADTAYSIGHENLSKPDIADAIARAQQERGTRVLIDQEWVMRRLRAISDRCMQAAPVLDGKGTPVMVENDDGEIVPAFVFNAAGVNRATELLGKHLGM